MDWNGTFVSPPQLSLNFLYNFNCDQYPVMEMKHRVLTGAVHGGVVPPKMVDKNQEKKKPLTGHQLDSLERSFQEEIKLDPDRKMRLSRELGLQPRQIAVWFQKRRAIWKTKQLERLYDSLKQDYDVVSREKQKLQDGPLSFSMHISKTLNPHSPLLMMLQVMKLKGMLMQQITRNQVLSTGCTEISGEETIENTTIRSSNKPTVVVNSEHPMAAECNYVFNVEEFNPVVSSPYWGTTQLPSYP